MSYKCSICAKGPSAGNTISHSHKATKRRFMPNLRTKRIMVNGKSKRVYICTQCIKSGKAVLPKVRAKKSK